MSRQNRVVRPNPGILEYPKAVGVGQHDEHRVFMNVTDGCRKTENNADPRFVKTEKANRTTVFEIVIRVVILISFDLDDELV